MPRPVKIILIVIAAIIVLTLSVPFFLSLIYYGTVKVAQTQYKDIQTVDPSVPLTIFKFKDSFQFNTADPGHPKTAKFRFSLGYESNLPKLESELKDREPQFKQLIHLILTQKKADQLIGAENTLELTEEIRANLNHVLTEGKVLQVYVLESSIR